METFENTILEKSVFIENLIILKIRDVNYIIDNYYFMLSKLNVDAIKYNESLIHLVNKKTKLTTLPEDNDVNIKLNTFIELYNKNTNADFKNIENGIITDIKSSIEQDFAKYMKNDYLNFESGFSKFLSNKINTVLFGVNNG